MWLFIHLQLRWPEFHVLISMPDAKTEPSVYALLNANSGRLVRMVVFQILRSEPASSF